METPRFRRPVLLTHPNLPRALHGLSPRSINGSGWWNKIRRSVYEVNNFCCFVCGRHKSECRPQHLEAHEAYNIDYQLGIARLDEIVALCKQCHTFIHSQRLVSLVDKGRISESYALSIMERGLEILEEAELLPTYHAMSAYLYLRGATPKQTEQHMQRLGISEPEITAQWSDWKLILGDQEYHSLYSDEGEWREYYSNRD